MNWTWLQLLKTAVFLNFLRKDFFIVRSHICLPVTLSRELDARALLLFTKLVCEMEEGGIFRASEEWLSVSSGGLGPRGFARTLKELEEDKLIHVYRNKGDKVLMILVADHKQYLCDGLGGERVAIENVVSMNPEPEHMPAAVPWGRDASGRFRKADRPQAVVSNGEVDTNLE
jgi:hypothetical protein